MPSPALIPLQCPRCSGAIPAAPVEVAWVCATCGQGLQIAGGKLLPLEFHYASGISVQGKGYPYWVASGRVSLDRQTYEGNAVNEAAKYWAAPRLFFIPAFQVTLEDTLRVGMNLLLRQPALIEGSAVPFWPVVQGAGDVRALAEFLVMNVEAERKDKLRALRFTLELAEAQMWVLP